MKQQKRTNYDNFISFLSNGLKNDLKKLRSFKRRNFLKHLNGWDSEVNDLEYFRGEILDSELIEILLRNFYKQEFYKAARKNHSLKIEPRETHTSILQSWLLKKENEFMEDFFAWKKQTKQSKS